MRKFAAKELTGQEEDRAQLLGLSLIHICPQVGEPVDHPRRERRGCAAGFAEDFGGNDLERASAGRAQTSPAGVFADRYFQHPVYLRRSL